MYGTINGARSLGIDNITGSLETGKNFDAVIADPAISTEPELVLDGKYIILYSVQNCPLLND